MKDILGFVACVSLFVATYWMIISDLCEREPLKGSIEEVKEWIGLIKAYHKARNTYLDYTPSYREFLEERGV